MVQIEAAELNPEHRIILVDATGNALEVQPSTQVGGADRLNEIRASLVAGISDGLLETKPFIMAQQGTERPSGAVRITETSKPASSRRQVETPEYYPEISEADELERQRGEATERIAVPLGIDINKFLAQLPSRFPDRNTDYDRFALKVPLLALDLTSFGVSWLQMTEAANFYDPSDPDTVLKAYIWSELRKRIEADKLEVWVDPREGVNPFPKVPHGVWVQDGSMHVNEAPKDARKNLQGIERAGDHWKGTSLTVLRPDMAKPMFWDYIGGHIKYKLLEPGDVPYGGWSGGPKFNYYWDVYANPRYRALVCGSEFTVA